MSVVARTDSSHYLTRTGTYAPRSGLSPEMAAQVQKTITAFERLKTEDFTESSEILFNEIYALNLITSPTMQEVPSFQTGETYRLVHQVVNDPERTPFAHDVQTRLMLKPIAESYLDSLNNLKDSLTNPQRTNFFARTPSARDHHERLISTELNCVKQNHHLFLRVLNEQYDKLHRDSERNLVKKHRDCVLTFINTLFSLSKHIPLDDINDPETQDLLPVLAILRHKLENKDAPSIFKETPEVCALYSKLNVSEGDFEEIISSKDKTTKSQIEKDIRSLLSLYTRVEKNKLIAGLSRIATQETQTFLNAVDAAQKRSPREKSLPLISYFYLRSGKYTAELFRADLQDEATKVHKQLTSLTPDKSEALISALIKEAQPTDLSQEIARFMNSLLSKDFFDLPDYQSLIDSVSNIAKS